MARIRVILVVVVVVAALSIGQSAGISKSRSDGQGKATQDTKQVNGLNHSEASVTVTFEGLLALCVNDKNQAEIGALRNSHHELTMEVNTITRQRDRERTSTVRLPVKVNEDIFIEAVNASKPGVSLYKNEGIVFNRADGTGDPEDFRWVMDLEGPEFHNRKLTITRPEMLRPRIFIPTGTLYTQEIDSQPMGLTAAGDDLHWTYLGKLAKIIAADISFGAGDEVIVRSGVNGSNAIRLKRQPGTRYAIAIKNTRHTMTGIARNDFHFWYDALQDNTGKMFDLRNVVLNTGAAFPVRYLDGFPESCLGGLLSRTRSLSQ